MAKSRKKQWLKTMRAQRWVELVENGGDCRGIVYFRRVPISEARATQLRIAASKITLLNGAHNSAFQYAEGAKPFWYSYTSGCKCQRCTPKDWLWSTWSDGSKTLSSIVLP